MISYSNFSIFTYFHSHMFHISYRSQLIYQLITFVCLYIYLYFLLLVNNFHIPNKKPGQTHLFDCWPIMEAYVICAKVPSKSAVQLLIKPTKGLRQISSSFTRRLQSAQLAQVRGNGGNACTRPAGDVALWLFHPGELALTSQLQFLSDLRPSSSL